jgi:hypothetical protein
MGFDHNYCDNNTLRHKTDEKCKNNYVTITFVQLGSLAAVPIGAQLDLASKIRVFERFRGGPVSAFALVSNLYFGRLCPNYGRLCTLWGSKRAPSCQLDLPKSLHEGFRQILLQYKMGALFLRKTWPPSTSVCLLTNI